MKKALIYFSIFANLLLIVAIAWMVQRLGGWNYARYRLGNDQAGLYEHRRQLFEELPLHPGALVLLGDSQMEQCEWAELLAIDSMPVLNRGITGDQLTGVAARLDEVARHKPSKIVLQIGLNDLILGKNLNETEAGYRALVQAIRTKMPDAQLLLVSLFPVNHKTRNCGVKNETIQQFNTRLHGIASSFALQYVDMYAPLSDSDGNLSPNFSADGLHLNGKGYLVWKNQLKGL